MDFSSVLAEAKSAFVRALLLKGLVDRAIVSGYLVRYELEEYRRALGLA